MLGVMSDQLKTVLNNERVAGTTFGGLQLALLLTGYPTITHATVYGDLSPFKPTFTGYADQAVGSWGSSVLTSDFHGMAVAGNTTFNNSSGSNSPLIYGWMLYSTVGGNKLLAAGNYQTPFVVLAGNSYQTNPSWEVTGE
jgi:hypothetical protein